MSQNKKVVGFLAGFTMLLIMGCYKDKTVILDSAEITRPVSLAADITPIFNNSCALSGCHSAGGKSPNLSVGNAYNSLVIGGYVNTTDAQSSLVYQWMSGKKSTPMPVGGINKDYNALILAWIKQGAQNN